MHSALYEHVTFLYLTISKGKEKNFHHYSCSSSSEAVASHLCYCRHNLYTSIMSSVVHVLRLCYTSYIPFSHVQSLTLVSGPSQHSHCHVLPHFVITSSYHCFTRCFVEHSHHFRLAVRVLKLLYCKATRTRSR